ncbi:MAG: hypothetical protein RI911_815 [Candidatus Parcubacteria bacterium]|jgi:S-adenosylmethionine:tRNA ribosyltransferase-isomerase
MSANTATAKVADNMHFKELLQSYHYDIPPELVATTPAHPRDSARLMVYERTGGRVSHTHFHDILTYLPPRSVLVCNNTKVIPARLYGVLPRGKRVELFVTSFVSGGPSGTILSNRNCDPGDVIQIDTDVHIRILRKEGKESTVTLESVHSWNEILERYGTTPIPPYLSHTPLSEAELRTEYQTVFAEHDGSVAAPTASLHFTDTLLGQIRDAGHDIVFVTLHVNLGTFAPLTEEAVASGRLHQETFYIPQDTITVLQNAKQTNRHIIPVGTTALRTIESAFTHEGVCAHSQGVTDLFIQEGYSFKMSSGLITNFHVPESSLMMLVAALVGREKLLALYQSAIAEKYRFFSFGDGMLIL